MSEAKKGNKVLLYYNAYSGSGVFKNNLDYIVERCQEEGFQVVPVRASKGYVIEETLANLDQNEYDRIIAAGGDGTINICVNAMIRHDIRLPLALLPAGTANDSLIILTSQAVSNISWISLWEQRPARRM